jgi:methionyl-tRNA formyltransferase
MDPMDTYGEGRQIEESGKLRLLLVGEARVAEFALKGMLRAGHTPAAIITTDVMAARTRSSMAATYYADLTGLGCASGIEVHVVSDLNAEYEAISVVSPDYVFVIGWPYLVRDDVLSIAPCVGLHPTKLPYRRGGAPLNWAILDGEPTSAVSLIRLRKGVDDGEILAQRTFPIGPNDYIGDVIERVYAMTEEVVADAVRDLAAGTAHWRPQDNDLATYTRRRRPEDGRIRWTDSAARIRNLVRAISHPFPGAFTHLDGIVLRVWRAEIPRGYRAPIGAAPGTLLDVTSAGVLISTMDNALLITEGQFGEDGNLLSGESLRNMVRTYRGQRLE